MVIHTGSVSQQAVAVVDYDGNNIEDAMQYAFRWTQNLDGSWSQGEDISIDGYLCDNLDYNEKVKVLAPLRNHLGRTYGHRSSSVGDIMIVEGESYKVASFGFEKIEIDC
jgi:hypothetical protein